MKHRIGAAREGKEKANHVPNTRKQREVPNIPQLSVAPQPSSQADPIAVIVTTGSEGASSNLVNSKVCLVVRVIPQ